MRQDANGQEVALGDTVMLARTGKSAGISWRRLTVTRMTDKSFWAQRDYIPGRSFEDGPHPFRNCIKVG